MFSIYGHNEGYLRQTNFHKNKEDKIFCLSKTNKQIRIELSVYRMEQYHTGIRDSFLFI